MNKDRFFSKQEEVYDVTCKVVSILNSNLDLFNSGILGSPRAMGDIIQDIIENNLDEIIGKYSNEFSANFARRAMADLAFKDISGSYCVVDVKTHNKSTDFNMPNLISVERLSRFYEDDENTFAILMIGYSTENGHPIFDEKNIIFCPIEFILWSSLTIGALGWGQIQIANSNNIRVEHSYSRKDWMIALCKRLMHFYPKEIEKISKRLEYFNKVESRWQNGNSI